MPDPLSDDELDEIVDDVIAEVGATSLRDIGRVMADVMPRVSGRPTARPSARSSARSLPEPRHRVRLDRSRLASGSRRLDRGAARTARTGADGSFDQVHDRPWSTVIRSRRRGQRVLQGGAPPLRHEAALTELLGVRRPDCIPPPLAIDSAEGWMLMEDGGQTLRQLVEVERDLSRWNDVLPLYAGVQIDLMDDVPALLAIGVPDFRLASLPTSLRGAPRSDRRTAGRGTAPAPGRRCPGFARRATSSPLRGSRRRSSTTICTTPRSSFATAATCSSTGAMPASRIRSSPWR